MRADVNTIQVAMRGRQQMLRAIFGSSDESDDHAPRDRGEVARELKARTKAHNAAIAKRKGAAAVRPASATASRPRA